MLNLSIISIITKRSSYGCFTPLASSFENRMSLSIYLCFRGDILWMLFICLYCDFLMDLNDALVDVFISSIALWKIGRVVFVPQRSFVFVLIIIPGSAVVSLLYKFLQIPFSYELLYLLLQVSAIFCVVVVILVKTTIFLLVTHIG